MTVAQPTLKCITHLPGTMLGLTVTVAAKELELLQTGIEFAKINVSWGRLMLDSLTGKYDVADFEGPELTERNVHAIPA